MPERRRIKGEGKAEFLAHLKDIQEKISADRPQKAIYAEYANALGIQYAQFSYYVRRYIKKGVKNETPTTKSEVQVSQSANPPAKTPAPAPVPQKVEPAKQEKPETPGAESAPRKGPVFVAPKAKKPFIYDPTKIDIKDLVRPKEENRQ